MLGSPAIVRSTVLAVFLQKQTVRLLCSIIPVVVPYESVLEWKATRLLLYGREELGLILEIMTPALPHCLWI
jgi:hypothetical protein